MLRHYILRGPALGRLGSLNAGSAQRGLDSARTRLSPGWTQLGLGLTRSALCRVGSQADVLPEFFPVPEAGVFGEGVAQLVGEHQDLAAVVGFVGEDVGEHGAGGGPGGHPAVADELGDAAIRVGGESIREHALALGGTFLESSGGLLLGAAMGI
jgi:hypothetical protein